MKKIISAAAASIMLLSASAAAAPSLYYPACGIVTRIDRQADLVTFTDFNGNDWTFDGVEDWALGDIAAAIMDDNGTESVCDDEIVTVQYAGYITGYGVTE